MRISTLFLLLFLLLSCTACTSAYNVGVKAGSEGESYLSGNTQLGNLALFPSDDISLSYGQLSAGALDFIVTERSGVDTASLPSKGLKLIDVPIVGDFYALAVSPRNSTLLNSLNRALAAREADITPLFTAPQGTAYAPGTPDPSAENQLIVAVALDSTAFASKNGEGKLVGAELEMVEILAEQLGMTPVFLESTAKDAISAVSGGTADLAIGGLSDDGSYTGRVNFSSVYYSGDYQVIVCPTACTLFDGCRESDELHMVLRNLKKQSELEASWNTFYRAFVTQGGYRPVLNGLLYTVIIAVCGLLIGIVIGTLIATVKVMPKYKVLPRILEKIADVYVGFFRGTPIIVQLLIGYFVLLPALGVSIERLWVAVIVYGMNSGAYVSEIMRSGIQSVDPGQLEASRALGLGYPISMLKVVIPQAVKNILPTLGNEFITLIKDTSVVSFIAIVDVTKAFRQIGDATYEYVIPYLMLALVYLVMVGLISAGVRLMERGLKKNER